MPFRRHETLKADLDRLIIAELVVLRDIGVCFPMDSPRYH